jgi:hypothetical protein
MSRRRSVITAMVAALLAAACGSTSNQATTAPAQRTTTQPGPGETVAPQPATSTKASGGNAATPGANPASTRAQPGGGGTTKKSSKSSQGPAKPAAAKSPSSQAPAFPQAGTYTYKQSGYEDFCQGQACTRDNLPPTMTTSIRYRKRSKSGGTIVLSSKPSSHRTDRVTIVFDSKDAGVTQVVSQFSVPPLQSTSAFSPNPPMQVLRFPLQSGMQWSGSWSGNTSGKYTVHVLGTSHMTVGGRSVTAYRIARTLDLSGDVQGHDAVTQWFDPATGIVVKSIDNATFQNQYGSYRSKSTTELSSGGPYG